MQVINSDTLTMFITHSKCLSPVNSCLEYVHYNIFAKINQVIVCSYTFTPCVNDNNIDNDNVYLIKELDLLLSPYLA